MGRVGVGCCRKEAGGAAPRTPAELAAGVAGVAERGVVGVAMVDDGETVGEVALPCSSPDEDITMLLGD